MQTKTAGELSKLYWDENYNCAESIVKALWDIWSEKKESYPTKYASAFCGGIGECKQDICGAITGGVLLAGALYGREKGGEDIRKACAISMEYRHQFKEKFKNTICVLLTESMEKRTINAVNCKELTAEAADILNNIIRKMNEKL